MSYLPCINEQCKSYGKPHPNCHCHEGFAEGGNVGQFCSSNNEHSPMCELHSPGIAPSHAVAGYLAQKGLAGLINLSKEGDPQKYHASIMAGHKNIDTAVHSLFGSKEYSPKDNTQGRNVANKWMEDGGVINDIQQANYEQNSPQNFAEGGKVEDEKHLTSPMIEQKYPSHNMLLQSSKGNISQYLNSLRPQKNSPKLAFDHEPDDTEKKRSYDKALNIAVDPLNIMHEIKKGSLEQEQVKHFNGLYPELNSHLQDKLMMRISEAQLKGEKPSYKVRQALSMFMGTPLSGELTPQGIQAAQSVFQSPQAPQQQGQTVTKNKKNTSPLTKSDQAFLSASQTLEKRQQKV
jgi:hypothetical protein